MSPTRSMASRTPATSPCCDGSLVDEGAVMPVRAAPRRGCHLPVFVRNAGTTTLTARGTARADGPSWPTAGLADEDRAVARLEADLAAELHAYPIVELPYFLSKQGTAKRRGKSRTQCTKARKSCFFALVHAAAPSPWLKPTLSLVQFESPSSHPIRDKADLHCRGSRPPLRISPVRHDRRVHIGT